MKHELRQFLEKEFQSYDDLKGLSERLKTSAAAIETMIAPDSHNDVNLAGVNKSAANLILSALFQGKPYESGEYKPQKSIGIPFCRESIFRANLETICRELEALKRYAGDKTTFETTLETEKKIYQRISEAAEKLRYFLDKDKEAGLKAFKESPLFKRNIFDTASYEVVIPKELTSTLRQIAIINDTVTALDKLAKHIRKEFGSKMDLSDFNEVVAEGKRSLQNRKESILKPVVKPEISDTVAAMEKAFEYWRERFFNQPPSKIEELKQLAEQIRLRNNDRLDKPTDQDAINAVKKQLEDNGIAILSIKSGPCKTPKTKEITLDLSQPIKEIERFNKKLGKTIDKMSQIPPELLGTGMNYQTYEHTETGQKYAFPEIKADEVKKELEKRETDIKVLEEIKRKSKEMHQATNPEEGPIKVPEILRDLSEGQNKIATILQKRLQNGNI